ncbi:MAG: hypothetical protein KDA31_02295 [Phycisphaerales bacterium]|nr:hypothetical protein [Phycisphaerales bacterium]MCB9835661.1 hypothetical protein [Phycisphaera sp.]
MDDRITAKLRPNEPRGGYVCRRCGDIIPETNVDRKKQRAECGCGAKNNLRSISESLDVSGVDLENPPSGVWREVDYDGVRIGASAASFPVFLISLGLAAFWNGLVGFFSIAGYGSAYMHLTGAKQLLAGWEISKDLPLSPGMTAFFILFLIPFQIIGVAMIWATLMALGGRVDVILRGETSRVENRFGILALIDRFRARDVRHVHLLSTRDEDGRKETASTVEIWYDDERKPGKRKHARLAVPKARRWWLAAALRDALTNNDGSKLR